MKINLLPLYCYSQNYKKKTVRIAQFLIINRQLRWPKRAPLLKLIFYAIIYFFDAFIFRIDRNEVRMLLNAMEKNNHIESDKIT